VSNNEPVSLDVNIGYPFNSPLPNISVAPVNIILEPDTLSEPDISIDCEVEYIPFETSKKILSPASPLSPLSPFGPEVATSMILVIGCVTFILLGKLSSIILILFSVTLTDTSFIFDDIVIFLDIIKF
jgi:hypothetical protein